MANELDDVGGMAFPFRIDPQTGGVSWATGADKLRQNIRVLIGTRHGERPMLRDFGTRVHSLVHEPNDGVLADLVRTQLQQALLTWEPRVLVLGADVTHAEGELRVRLRYAPTNEPSPDELVLVLP
ncbi:GPW/gp25 family protein [Myxococcus sp. RHSTA-1-4]|uniref:GPW/gp25 family protein n=1 Tax=Myxococcus sp. RHSTA-1-4 TaxID=2874601 RepID=UPI001CC14B8B|nr:GPW/gp25 family protein [Myxococcus sp. RHSTA-1-4]MBZ4417429.1 GPW/gp25 family protein [Myxococcus sp. RHSTA-1-4]